MLLLIEQYAFAHCMVCFFMSCLWCFCASVPAQIPLFSGIIERERAICRLIEQYAFRYSLLCPCYCFAPVIALLAGACFSKWVLFCCACSVKNKLFFVCVLFYFCSTLGAGYRSPIVLLFKSWSKKSLLVKIKQRESGELLAPAPPLPLLGGFIRLFL
jgi:hypothetical protein